MINKTEERESVKVLRECIDLQLKKSQDYQNPNSNVTQAMHYRRGVDTIFDTMNGKMLRIQSLIESGTQTSQNFESIEDSFKDLINYASFAVSYIRGKMEGQDPTRDMFNRKKLDQEAGRALLDAMRTGRTQEFLTENNAMDKHQ